MPNIHIYLAIFFESISFFMCLFFFLQYNILRRKEHLYYALYLLAVGCYYILAIPPLFFKVTPHNQAVIDSLDIFKRPVQFLTSVFYTYFVIYYLGLKNAHSPLYKFFRFLIVAYLLMSGLCLLLNFLKIGYNNFFYIANMLLLPMQLYVVISLLRNPLPYSKYIIWGTIMILFGSTITLLISIYGPKPVNLMQAINIFLPVQFCILIDVYLFAVALQKKIADNEKSLIDASYQRQHAIMVERERIITDLHDDVGGGLSSIRMLSDLMAQQSATEQNGNTTHFAQKISATAKEIAQRMNTIIWSLNVENDTLGNFVEYVRHYGISYFENSGVAFQCFTGTDLPENLQIKGVLRKNLFLIIKESFHNILKHANASNATVHILVMKDKLSIQVKDNGTGITNPNQFGNGLKNMRKRAEEIQGDMKIHSNNGTIIELSVFID